MEELYDQYRALLFTLAYQLTGSSADAEDVVQDVFFKACDVHPERLEKPKAYLCKMVTNHCLDLQKSARRRREVYVGPWLPEPIRTPEAVTLETTVVRRDLGKRETNCRKLMSRARSKMACVRRWASIIPKLQDIK